MDKITVDTHVHSITSIHAYSTIQECVNAAKKKGLSAIAITDHFGPQFCCKHLWESYSSISGQKEIPNYIDGIRVINGIEIDIVDKDGHLAYYNETFPYAYKKDKTILERILENKELVIASRHEFDEEFSMEENTKMYIEILKNPQVDILGHCDRVRNLFNIDNVLETAYKYKKIIEINEMSLNKSKKQYEYCKKIARLCAQLGCFISLGSDSHNAFQIGNFIRSYKLLNEIDFPVNLIANLNLERFYNIANFKI